MNDTLSYHNRMQPHTPKHPKTDKCHTYSQTNCRTTSNHNHQGNLLHNLQRHNTHRDPPPTLPQHLLPHPNLPPQIHQLLRIRRLHQNHPERVVIPPVVIEHQHRCEDRGVEVRIE